MKAFRALAQAKANSGYIKPFIVLGDENSINEVIDLLVEAGSVAPLARKDFKLFEVDEIHLDPGGMLMMGEEAIDFTIDNFKFSVYPHKVEWVTKDVTEAQESLTGWVRVGLGPGSMRSLFYFKKDIQEKLLCHLMGLEFMDGVKESRDHASALGDEAFHRGLLARPTEGGFKVCREGDSEELNPEDPDFDIPEGIEPF